MALSLPKAFALKAHYNDKHLALIQDERSEVHGLLKPSVVDVKQSTVFEVVAAKGEDGLVHLKSSHNKKYLRRLNQNQWWIGAVADEPDEDKSKWTCTLLKPILGSNGDAKTLQLFHVQLGRYIRPYPMSEPYDLGLFAAEKGPDKHKHDVFTIVESGHPGGTGGSSLNPDGSGSSLIPGGTGSGGSLNPGGTATGKSVIPGGTGCGGSLINPDGTSGGSSSPVSGYPGSWDIRDVKFELNDARTKLYGQNTVELTTGVVPNRENTRELKLVTLEYDKSESGAWKLGTDTSNSDAIINMTSPIPVIVSGNIVLSNDQFSGLYGLGTTLETTYSHVKTTYSVVVPPMTQAIVTLKATQASFDVPFSYTRHETLANGAKESRNLDDGTYTGVSLYNFRYETELRKL